MGFVGFAGFTRDRVQKRGDLAQVSRSPLHEMWKEKELGKEPSGVHGGRGCPELFHAVHSESQRSSPTVAEGLHTQQEGHSGVL